MKLWVSIVITLAICGLLVFGGMSILNTGEDKAEPYGNIAESSANDNISDVYRDLLDSS